MPEISVSPNGTPLVTVTIAEDKSVVPPLQMRKTTTHLQWRYKDVTAWENLIPIVDLIGPSSTEALYPITITNGHNNDEHYHPLDCLVVKGEFFGMNGKRDLTVDIEIVDNSHIRLVLLAAEDENTTVSGFLLITKVA